MDELIKLIEQIDADPNIVAKYDYFREYGSTLVAQASELACKTLITEKGGCNWKNIELLRDAGYDVFPVERDRFGWLIGGIQTRKGIIVYD
jgi:hypothetical protein